ncbi:MAG: SDR family NAD(P)-dependent oxidoreductase [Spirochaetaceae bacterium]|nr:SDR family NAD(P)-dependent oxidoreductase [Spirochaetaceae bacterium]
MSEEKWAVITGASQGIGRAMAAEAARRGLNLLLIALPDTGLPVVADELSRLYDVESEFWEFDLSDRAAIADFVEYVRVSRRTVELLVNNAGIGGTVPFAEQNPDRLASMIDVNVGALTVLTRLLVPYLMGQSEAHILNVASLAGWFPSPGMSVYAATKAYVISFSLALRDELEGTGVSVSVLCPSGVVTKESVVKALSCQGFWGRRTSRYPDQLARYALPRAYRKRRILVPGVINQMLRIAGRVTPLRLLTRMVGGRISGPGKVSTRRDTARAPHPHRATMAAPERTPA